MTPVVLEKFTEGKKLLEGGANELLPLLRDIQAGEDITGNSPEYKKLCKAIDGLNSGKNSGKDKAESKAEATETNKDGLVKGSEVKEEDYWAIINKQKAKK